MLKTAWKPRKNKTQAGKRWLALSKLYRMGRLTEKEAEEYRKQISSRRASSREELTQSR